MGCYEKFEKKMKREIPWERIRGNTWETTAPELMHGRQQEKMLGNIVHPTDRRYAGIFGAGKILKFSI
jgi:hypothetical protein